MNIPGQLYILSAPSGCGKTTILKRVMRNIPGISFSVSHTTRSPRGGEINGVDYHFVAVEEFRRMRDSGSFLEWAEVHGNYYGTSRSVVQAALSDGCDIILDIDVQGAAIIRKDPDVRPVTIFVAPPSLGELERRLRGRGTDTDATIELRLKNAEKEMEDISCYDYLVVNDILDDAVLVLQSIVIAERSRGRRSVAGQPLFPEIANR